MGGREIGKEGRWVATSRNFFFHFKHCI